MNSYDNTNTVEEELRNYKFAVDQHSIVAITDKQGRILYVNDKFCEISKYSREELIGKDHRLINSGHHPREFFRDLYKTIHAGRVWKADIRNKAKDGTFYWVATTITPFKNREGVITEFIAIRTDITDNKKVEEELILQKEKAEGSDRLKSAFLANMRHEIRNPMNAIIGFSKQLATPGLAEVKRAEYSSIVINSSQQLLSIIDDITAISLLESKQDHVNKSEVHLKDLFFELEAQFATQAKTRNLTLSVSTLLTNDESVVLTDKSKITRILTNLLTNALKFTHTGGIEFGYKIEGALLICFVKDTGIGIADSNKEKIFERFQQADGRISRKYGGSGLGLSISKGLTELLGGKIWFESQLNNGSVFYVSIPFTQINTSSRSRPSLTSESKLSILIAEDEEINFYYLKIIFESRFNCEILHARNGSEAVELVKKHPAVSLILMDISMPILDGFDAAILIKESNPHLPIIAQTGYDIQTNEKYSPVIFDDYISKPVDDTILTSKAQRYISRTS